MSSVLGATYNFQKSLQASCWVGEKGTKISERRKVLRGAGGKGRWWQRATIQNTRQDNVTGDGEKTPRSRAGDVSGDGWEGLWRPQPGHVEHADGTLLLGGTRTALK